MKIYEKLRKAMKIYENLRKSTNIYENLWKSLRAKRASQCERSEQVASRTLNLLSNIPQAIVTLLWSPRGHSEVT